MKTRKRRRPGDPRSRPRPTEKVSDYPRPPALETVPERLTVSFAREIVADTRRGIRVLETHHPPTYYFPPEDVQTDLLHPAPGSSLCEWKGTAVYRSLVVGNQTAYRAVWSYPSPRGEYGALAGHVAFYPGPMDSCTVGPETVHSQDGDFYGGWITSWVEGPFKGGPGTRGW